MEPQEYKVVIKVQLNDGTIIEKDIPHGQFNFKMRVIRALKGFLFFFALGLLSILLPVIHFVLVPAFLIFSVVNFFWRLRQVSYVDLTHQMCPQCQSPIKEKKVFQSLGDTQCKVYCFGCRANIIYLV